jgi:hypothetical protein
VEGLAVSWKSASTIVTTNAEELDVAKFESPVYSAVIWCVPAERDVVAKVATPEASRGATPIPVEPSVKLTLPVRIEEPRADMTVAVIVMLAPRFAEEGPVRVVVVAICAEAPTVVVASAEVFAGSTFLTLSMAKL